VRIWQRCGALAAAVVMLGGCGAAADLVESADEAGPTSPTPTDPTTSPTEPSPDPTTPTAPTIVKPKPGECRRIDAYLMTLGTDTAERRTIPCQQPHNAQTYFVGLMGQAGQDAAKSGNPVRLRRELTGVCARRLTDWLGGSGEDVAVSVFDYIVTAPGPDLLAAGARWFTCDLYAVRVANDSKLAAIPPRTQGILNSGKARDWSRCNLGNFPGGTTNIVVCTRRHTYRAVGGIHLGGGNAKYPGGNSMDRSLESACTGPVQTYLGRTDGYRYAWTWPSRGDWNDGNHWGLCYVKLAS
jgi:Septum formation